MFIGIAGIIGAGKSIQIVIAMLVQFFYILLIERFAPYELDRDDVIQFIASIQLFLTLFAGLLFKLREKSSDDEMDPREKEIYGAICIFLNLTVLISGIFSIYLATSHGKMCWKRFGAKESHVEKTNGKKKNVQVKPVQKEEVAKSQIAQLSAIRSKHGASSKEYKVALEKMKP